MLGKGNRISIAKIIFKKKKKAHMNKFIDFKTSSITTLIKTVWYLQRNRQLSMDHNRASRNKPTQMWLMDFDNGAKVIWSFRQTVLEQLNGRQYAKKKKKKNLDLNFMPDTKNNSKLTNTK